MQKELPLEMTEQAISNRLKPLGKIQHKGIA